MKQVLGRTRGGEFSLDPAREDRIEKQALEKILPGRPLTDSQRLEQAQRVVGGGPRKHLISCPYCVTGGGIVEIRQGSGGQMHIDGAKEPLQCGTCSKFFKVQPQLRLIGVPLQGT